MSGQILIGDNRATLATLPAGSVDCVVTSPPYYALRSYLPADHPDKHLELGSERTPEEYLANQLGVFRAVRRVLKDWGTLWINLGDSYASAWPCHRQNKVGNGSLADGKRANRPSNLSGDLKDGDLLNMPHRFALALVADGWYHRDTIIWAKRSPMPSSQNAWRWERCRVKVLRGGTVRRPDDGSQGAWKNGTHFLNEGTLAEWEPCPGCPKCLASPRPGYILRKGRFRTTTAHEYLFLFTKSARYFMDAEASREKATTGANGSRFDLGKTGVNGEGRVQEGYRDGDTRIPRSVWTLSTEPYKGKHFATFPSTLPRKCIEMSTSTKGCCAACGMPYAPVVETERVKTRPGEDTKINVPRGWASGDVPHTAMDWNRSRDEVGNRDPYRHVTRNIVKDHWPTCSCNAGSTPAVILDPYGGSGTTAQAAQALGRDWILCELYADYVNQAKIDTLPKWARPKQARPIPAPVEASLPLLDLMEARHAD